MLDLCNGPAQPLNPAEAIASMTGANTHRWGPGYPAAQPDTGGNPWQAALFATGGASLADVQRRARALGFDMTFADVCDSLIGGYHIVAGPNHRSTNTQVATRALQGFVHSKSQRRWIKCGGPERPTGQIDKWGAYPEYGVQDRELAPGSLIRQRPACNGTVTLQAPVAPYDSEAYANWRFPVPLSDIDGFGVAYDEGLTLIDPAGPDDRDMSEFVSAAWFDLGASSIKNTGDGNRYKTQTVWINGQPVESRFIPNHSFDGGRARQERVQNGWRRRELVTVVPAQNPGLSLPYAWPEWQTPHPASISVDQGGFAWTADMYKADPCPFEVLGAAVPAPVPVPVPTPVPAPVPAPSPAPTLTLPAGSYVYEVTIGGAKVTGRVVSDGAITLRAVKA